jgi:hypothetical protein
VYHRDNSPLLTNTVPALVVRDNETLWLGTALGLQRVQGEQWTTFPFTPNLPVQGDPETLERFFQPVVQALFAARPLAAIGPDGAFLAQFGASLRKEDFVYSLVADRRGRLWVGTLGGGLRRIDGDQQTVHLTHRDGLPSNLIVALAVGPNREVWVATEAGVTRIEEDEGENGVLTMTTFTALDGLALPVRDVAVDTAGIAWVATDRGLFRLVRQRGRIAGVVHDPMGQPVAGVDVIVQGTPLRAVTDATGRFVVDHLPPGEYVLVADGRLAVAGPFAPTQQDITVVRGAQTLAPVRVAQSPRLFAQAGQGAAVTVNTPLSLVVQAADRFGTPLDGVPVTFQITHGNGSLAAAVVHTGANGQATVAFTVGTQAGINQVQASAAGVDPIVLTVTGLADRANARLQLVSGNDQVGFPDQVLHEPLVVRLEDRFANPLPGEAIVAQLIEGSGTFVDPPQLRRQQRRPTGLFTQTSGGATRMESTDASGQARFFLRVDSLAGVVDVRTTAPALHEVREQQFRVDIARINVGAFPVALTVVDVNGDGHLDVLTVNSNSGDISVLRGRGDGAFADEQRFGVGRFPRALAVVDVDGDGHLDVLTANESSQDISVLRGRGDGTFAAQRRFRVDSTPVALAVADVDGDEHLDVLTANESSQDISVLRGRGDGTFADEQRFGVGRSPEALTVADVDGDGHLDVLTANAGSGDISVLRGWGDGTFADEQRFVVVASARPVAIVVVDVDGDGHLDVLTANASTDISVLRGRGDGTFVDEQRLGVGNCPEALAVVDVDGDGHLDVLTANICSTDISVLRGRGNGIFTAPQRIRMCRAPEALAVADVDEDGHLDVLTANAGSGDISVLQGRGDGTFVGEQCFGVGASPRALVVADVDGDGRFDVLTANAESDDISVLQGRGDGTFADERRFGAGNNPEALAVVDVDGDGHLDVLTANAHSGDISVLRGRGDGTFADARRFGAGDFPQALTVVDIDGDGHLDVLTANRDSQDISVLRGRGDGTFADARRFAVGTLLRTLVVADIDGDGDLDVLTVNNGPVSVSVLRGRGDGTFADAQPFGESAFSSALVVMDVDGDGHLDVLTANDSDVSVLRGQSDGTFASEQRFRIGHFPRALVVADVNGDRIFRKRVFKLLLFSQSVRRKFVGSRLPTS